ncbi:MAG: V-type ATP synthase subunit E [Firmicutes bacterium]|nr:V-type ATP synthase subunit E [Bacillota bacterium]
MFDKDNFLEDIRKSAELQAESLIMTAKQKQEDSLNVLEKALSDQAELEHQRTLIDAEQILSHRATDTRITKQKIVLSAKQKIVDSVYYEARQFILDMSDSEYFDFIGGLIAKHAVNNDKVIFADRDKKRIPKDFLDLVATKHKLKLYIADKTHSDLGGVILEGKNYDKNLTLETLLKLIRQKTENDVAELLFS